MNTKTFAEEMVLCSLPDCLNVVHAVDAIWDEKYDDPYCSSEHMAEAQQNRLMAVMDIEDLILYGEER